MSVSHIARPLETSLNHFTTRAPWWRALALGVLLAFSLAISVWLISRSPLDAVTIDVNNHTLIASIFSPYSLSFLPYLLACVLVFVTRPASGRWRWLELGLILGGAAVLRILLLPLPPNLSRDSWRYVWDARVFLHGYSPYVYAPGNNVLKPLWDVLFANSRYRNVPTIYPPGAQYIYILSYVFAPSNLYFLKGMFVVFDLASCAILAKLLVRKGLDPARVILYAWCPLSIVEFALQGHMDVLPVTFTLLAVLSTSNTSWRGRGLTGFLIGIATLTKLYPIIMLASVVRLRMWRRDWLLVLTCLLTIVLGYLPFYIQGNGQIFGFFSVYSNEQGANAGFIQLFVAWFGDLHHFSLATIITQEHLVAFLMLVSASLVVFLLRQYERISLEAGMLLLFGLVFAISSHVFPWYTTMLLPWIALLLPTHERRLAWPLLIARVLALLALFIFACISVVSYVQSDPLIYYRMTYYPLVIELALAVVIALSYSLPNIWQKGTSFAKQQPKTID
ncbi:MAG: glycosyltransferase 87 family protein [Ktedonobacteraceae bacterium]